MEIQVRLATAQDRTTLDAFYKREGIDFHGLTTRSAFTPIGSTRETMYVVAAAQDMIVAALRLDVAEDPELGDVGYIQHFEVEDELEGTDLGLSMLEKTIEIATEKRLRALDAIVREDRADVMRLYLDSEFNELHKEVYLRRSFRERIF
ncbi:MAG: GNAT family N-acetyltransferase [Promethearchaeota archaeon]